MPHFMTFASNPDGPRVRWAAWECPVAGALGAHRAVAGGGWEWGMGDVAAGGTSPRTAVSAPIRPLLLARNTHGPF